MPLDSMEANTEPTTSVSVYKNIRYRSVLLYTDPGLLSASRPNAMARAALSRVLFNDNILCNSVT